MRMPAEQQGNGVEPTVRRHFVGVGTAYRMLRHLAVAVAALCAVLIETPSKPIDLALRIAAALVVIALDVAPIGDKPRQRGSNVDPLFLMVALVGLGVINPGALVPVAVALTAAFLCFLGPSWMHAPAAVVQLGGTVLIGARSDHAGHLWLLLSIMVLTDVSKALGAHLIDDRLGVLGQRFDAMVENNQAVAATLTERLRHQRAHDDLTGLPNRAQLTEHLRAAVVSATASEESFALLVVNLTQFWQINDALGHAAGDRLLAAIAERLRAELGDDCAVIGRLGGDEFALVSLRSGGADEAAEAGALALRTVGALALPFDMDGTPIQANASVGVALFPTHATDDEGLCRAADLAMHRAKRSGQPFELYHPDRHRGSLRQVTLLGEFGRAITAGELTLHYQPVLDLRAERIVQVEGLVRWQHPDHGLMMPADFIETVERSHLIHPLTRWVVTRAVADAQAMGEAGLDLRVAVNLSVRNLQDPGLVDFFELLSHRENFHAGRLQLEITETTPVTDAAVAVDVLARLRSLGISVAVDDFGVGHSSLAYLKHLPVSHLKIDRGFVAAITSDAHDAAIVRSTIEMAHRLGLTVTAEGTADLATLLALRDQSCDLAQGFFLSKAVPFDELAAVVTALDGRIPGLLRSPAPIGAHAGYPSAPDATSPAQR